MQSDITKEQLKRKNLEQWSDEERAAAEEMGHTITCNYLLVRRLAKQGNKTQTYGDILESLLDEDGHPQDGGA